jgi:hypothetical protein
VYGVENNILYWADFSSQGRTKIYCNDTTSITNETTKEGPLSFVLFEPPFTSVSTVNRGHIFLVSLGLTKKKIEGTDTEIKRQATQHD